MDSEATGGTTAGTVWSFTTAAPPRGIVTLNAGDGFGSSSYNAAGNWNNSATPSLANDYFTSNKELRSPTSANGGSGTTIFGGYSLSLDSGGTLTTKGTNNNILAIERLYLRGGRVRIGDQNNLATISGSIAEVAAASTLDADQASRTLVLASPLTGSGRLTIASGTAAGGVVRLSGANDDFTGPWTINTGATLQVGNGGTSGSLGTGDLILNGALTFNRTGLLTLPGDISGTGTLTINSALALTLDGASTYTGATTVTTGSLFVTGSLGNTTVTVASAATLGGAGSLAGPVTLQGTLAAGATGQNSTGHLTFGGALTLASTTTTRLELNRTAAVTHDALYVTGAFTAAGSLAITNLGPALVAGDTFALFNKAPTSGSFASVTLPTLTAGHTWQNNLAVNGTLTVLGPPPPAAAAAPTPTDAATNVAITTSVSWTPGAGATTRRVYLGTDAAAVTAATTASPEYKGQQATTTFTPPAALANATTYYWRIDEVGTGGVTAGPVWSFTTIEAVPEPATTPAPAAAATNVALNTSLGWTAGLRATTHRVYLGTDSAAVAAATPATSGIYQGEQATTTFTPASPLANATTYFWRIDEVGIGGVTPGTVWRFTTIEAAPEPATTPAPADAAAGVATPPTLGWAAGSGANSHRVYLGTDSAAVASATTATAGIYLGEQASTTYTPSVALANATTYYWRIDEVGAGGVTPGPVWSFTTVAPVPPYDQWAAEQTLTPGVNDVITADPDADGRANLLEYILGGAARTADPIFNPTATNSGANVVYAFARADRSETDTTLVVQYGTSLLTTGTWTNVPIGASSGTFGDATVTITENAAGLDTVTVTIPRGSSPTLFVRLSATRASP